jgi:predicted nucleic acid-binding protein
VAVEEGTPLTLIVDTNVLVAALIQRGIVRELVLSHAGEFLTPDSCVEEVWDNRGDWNRKGIPDPTVRAAIDVLTEDFVSVVPRSVYVDKEGEASTLIRDPDDVPVVALALAVDNRGVWTFNTKDFSGPGLLARIRVLGTAEVKALLTLPWS